MKRLGADVMAVYPVGGAVGQLLRRLVDQEAIPGLTVPIAGETREDFTVLEYATGEQYRFILPGPQLSEQEWRACLEALSSLNRRVRFVVASGSLPPGVPEDFYARVALAVKKAKVKVVVDTAGTPLKAALASGVYLVKPNLRELTELIGGKLSNEKDGLRPAAALLVTRNRSLPASALPIKPASVVDARDTFLGAMIWTLASGRGIEDAFRYGIAAGSAAFLPFSSPFR
jgi:6-phosphofructokinase 2